MIAIMKSRKSIISITLAMVAVLALITAHVGVVYAHLDPFDIIKKEAKYTAEHSHCDTSKGSCNHADRYKQEQEYLKQNHGSDSSNSNDNSGGSESNDNHDNSGSNAIDHGNNGSEGGSNSGNSGSEGGNNGGSEGGDNEGGGEGGNEGSGGEGGSEGGSEGGGNEGGGGEGGGD